MPARTSDLSVGVGPVTLPPYLDRPQLVTRAGNRAVLAEFDSWPSCLGMFARSSRRTQPLGTDDVLTLPQRRALALDYQVEVDVTRFDVDTGGNAVLDARWWCSAGMARGSRGAVDRPSASRPRWATTAAAAALLSRALGAMSLEIARAIADQARS